MALIDYNKRKIMHSFYKIGLSRSQQLMFPPSIDDYVDDNNNVRAIDMYVDSLDTAKLKFANTRKSNKIEGQKAYSPKLMLKIYMYGYLNKIRSSRMLERECKRNIELMWLTQNLTPSYHTIADFRKDNPKALKQVFKEFVLLCKHIGLIGDGLKAVDGAFLRANASKNQLITKTTLKKDLKTIEENIDNYLNNLDSVDKEKQPLDLAGNLPQDIEKLKAKREILLNDLKRLETMDKTQHNNTDKDANLMIKPAHNLMAYNSQNVVDDKHKLIVATDISTKGSDVDQLHKMAKLAVAVGRSPKFL
jgi:transposase